tara:strand:+ start:215 stop:442 length:228 start_codon:yes stop_codon:yes gene_type:complete
MSMNVRSHGKEIGLTTFWGGDEKGSCIQITMPACLDKGKNTWEKDILQLTTSQAAALSADLMDFVTGRSEVDFND